MDARKDLAHACTLTQTAGVSFAHGFRLGLKGAAMLFRQPRLWWLVLVPFALSVAALVAVTFAAIALRERWLGALPGGLRPVFAVLSILVAPVVGYFLFFPVAALIAAPFNEAIAEAVEHQATGTPPAPTKLLHLLRDLVLAVAHELRKLVRWLLLAALLLILTLVVPGIGPIIGLVGGAAITAHFAAYDALDATFSRWGWGYEQKTRFLAQHRALGLGLGAFVAVLLAVPVLNALAMPLGAAGGALLALEATKKVNAIL
jgi:CysZ protein